MSTPGKKGSNFFFNPLRSRVLSLFTGVHLLLAIVLGDVFAFAPDEAGYLQIFKREYRSGFSTASVLGWSNSQTFFLRVVYSPAKVLSMVGVSDYLAIRILAIMTSAIAIYLLMCVSKYENKFGVPRVLQIIVFTPSLFLWMTLGLRESFIYLALSMICVGFYLIGQERGRVGFLFFFFGNLTLFETKSYLFLLVAFASLLEIVFVLAAKGRVRTFQGYVVLVLILPMVINTLGVKYLADSIKGQVSSVSSTGGASIATVANSNAQNASENAATTTTGIKSAISSHPKSIFTKILTNLGFNKSAATATPSPTKSATPSTTKPTGGYLTSRLNVTPAKIGNPISVVSRTVGFLFTPFPFIDNGSLFLNLASFESPFWWYLYAALAMAIWRRYRHKEVDSFVVFALSFSVLFILFSAFTEINVGTMARHRSVLVIPLLYLVVTKYKQEARELGSRT